MQKPPYGVTVPFTPWVGRQYGTQSCFGLPLLVIGERHFNHNNEPESQDFTEMVVSRYLSGTLGSKDGGGYFDWITAVLECATYGRYLSGHLWDSIVFYNYLVDVLQTKDDRPDSEMWTRAAPFCQAVVNYHNPSCILVVGKGLFAHVEECNNLTALSQAGTCSHTWLGASVIAVPAGRARAADWGQLVGKLIEYVKMSCPRP